MKIAKELRGLSAEELNNRKEDFQKELLKLNVQVASGANPKDAGKIKQLRKTLAIIETIFHQSDKKLTEKSGKKSFKAGEVKAK